MVLTPAPTMCTLFAGSTSAATTATWTVDGLRSPRPLTIDQTAQDFATLHKFSEGNRI
jgi:hypothetical protein